MTNPDCTTLLKRCTKCGTEYPATGEFFGPSNQVKSGLLARCRTCVSAYDHQRRIDNIEVRREYDRRYRAEHHEAKLANNHRYYAENREKLQEDSRRYDAANKDRRREKHREWEARNPDYARRQYAKNPELGRARSHARRARKLEVGGTYTPDDLAAIRAAQTDKKGRLICWRCGKPITDTPDLDHWIPLKHRGENGPGNLHYMHAHCNRTKHAKHPFDIGRLL
jgi:DNA-directed RNA polymerase subunit RPC12/RpoP